MWDKFKELIIGVLPKNLFPRSKLDELSEIMDFVLPWKEEARTEAVRYSLTDEYKEATKYIGPKGDVDQVNDLNMKWSDKVTTWFLDTKQALKKLEDGATTLAESGYKSFTMLHSFGVILNQFLKHGTVNFADNWIRISPDGTGLFDIAKKLGNQSANFFNRMTALSAQELLDKNDKAMAEAAKKIPTIERNLTLATKAGDLKLINKYQKELKEAQKAAKGRFGPDRNLFGRDEKGNMIDDRQMIQRLLDGTQEMYENNKQLWDQSQERLREINKSVLDFAEKAGLIDKETRADWERDNYVPFYRNIEDFTDGDVETLFPGSKLEISKLPKRLKGTKGHTIGDPFANLLNAYSYILYDGLRNLARKKSLSLAVEAGIAEKTDQFYKGNKVQIRTKGKSQWYRIDDPWLYDAITDLEATSRLSRIPLFSWAKRALTWGVTITPAFRLANAFRDTWHTFFIGSGMIPIYDSIRGAYHAWAETSEFTEYASTGGAFQGSFATHEIRGKTAKQVEKLRKKVMGEQTWWQAFWNAWEKVGEASENAARMGLYLRLRQKGKSAGDAAYEARDLLDFHKHGKSALAQSMIGMIPFLNARLQGLHKMGRNAMNKKTRKQFALRCGILASLAFTYGLVTADDEDRKEIPEYEKRTYFTIKLPGVGRISLPLPFEVGAFFITIPMAFGEYVGKARKGKELWTIFRDVMLENLAFNPIPQIMKPGTEYVTSKNFFTGQPTVTEREQDLEVDLQYSPRTHKLIQKLAPKLGLSPKKIDQLFRGYLGSMYDLSMDVVDLGIDYIIKQDPAGQNMKRLFNIMGIGRFFKMEKVRSYTRTQEKFYEMWKDFDKAAKSYDEYVELEMEEREIQYEHKKEREIDLAKPFRRFQKRISKINNEIRLLHHNKSMSPKDKREELDRLLIEREEIFAEALEEAHDELGE